MNPRATISLILALVLAAALLAGCGQSNPAEPVAQDTPAAQQPQGPAVEEQPAEPSPSALPAAQELPSPSALPAAEELPELIYGPGRFDLPDPTIGLAGVPRYKAVVRMEFEGTLDGQPYHRSATYTAVVDGDLGLRKLRQETGEPDGTATAWTAGTLGTWHFAQVDGQECYSGPATDLLPESEDAAFEPATVLPRVKGAEAAGDETVPAPDAPEGQPATVWTFDQRALGLDDGSSATGKIWLTGDAGLVLKYELSLTSSTQFGDSASGTQTWAYALTAPEEADLLPAEGCRLDATDLPAPEDATVATVSPGVLRYTTGLDAAALAEFYTAALAVDGWEPTADPLETDGGTRLVYGRMNGETQQIMLVTALPAEGGETEVTIWQAVE